MIPLSPLKVSSEAGLKIKVSRHVACCWNWTLQFHEDHEDDESGWTLTLAKSHPVWEIIRDLISHLPGYLPMWVQERDWYERMDSQYSADIAALSISDRMASLLSPPFWGMVNGHPDDG